MAWQADRPVPWRRLIRDWALFAAAMVVVFAFFAKAPASSYVGLVASLPLYLAFGGVLAKFGYTRKTLADLRAERAAAAEEAPARSRAATGPRPKPAPTKRTGGGTARRGAKRRR